MMPLSGDKEAFSRVAIDKVIGGQIRGANYDNSQYPWPS